MKKNVLIRLLAALGGVTLWCLGLCALAETFFQVPVTAKVGYLLGARTPVAVLLTLLLAIALCSFGVCGLLMLSNKRAGKRKGFVMQKSENGVIGVAIKSIEGLVQTCIRQHEVVKSAEIAVVERKDGIIVLLDIKEVAGVNIPLAVGALQKQIKQYVNECTGVDVHEVRVMVENTEENVVASPFAVKEPVVMTTAVTAAELQREAAEVAETAPEAAGEVPEVPVMPENIAEEPVQEIVPSMEVPVAEAPVEDAVTEEAAVVEETVVSAVQSAPVMMPVMPDMIEEEDDRPLHQRLFGMEEEPVFVPAPPELVIEPAVEEAVEEIVAAEEQQVTILQQEADETEMDANAVLEVVEAISEEPFILTDFLDEQAEVVEAEIPAEEEDTIVCAEDEAEIFEEEKNREEFTQED